MARFRVSRLRAAFRDPYLSQALTGPTLAKEKRVGGPCADILRTAHAGFCSARGKKEALQAPLLGAHAPPWLSLPFAWLPLSCAAMQLPRSKLAFPLSFTATTTSNLATPRALDQQLDCTHSFLDQLPLSPRPRTASIDPSADVESENPDGASAGACYCG